MGAQVVTGLFTLGGVLVTAMVVLIGAALKFKYDARLAISTEKRKLYADLLTKMNTIEEMLAYPHNAQRTDYYTDDERRIELRAAYRAATEATLAAELVSSENVRKEIQSARSVLAAAYFDLPDLDKVRAVWPAKVKLYDSLRVEIGIE